MFKGTIKIAPSYRMKLLSSSHAVYVTETKVSHLLPLLYYYLTCMRNSQQNSMKMRYVFGLIQNLSSH